MSPLCGVIGNCTCSPWLSCLLGVEEEDGFRVENLTLNSVVFITVTFPLIVISSLPCLRSPGSATGQTPGHFCYTPWTSSDDPSWSGLSGTSCDTLGPTFVSPWQSRQSRSSRFLLHSYHCPDIHPHFQCPYSIKTEPVRKVVFRVGFSHKCTW